MFITHILRTFSRGVVISNKNPVTVFSNVNWTNNCCNVRFSSTSPSPSQQDKEKIKVTFIKHTGERIEAEAKVNDTLLDVIIENDINIDGFGACEGTLTCSTCHVILKKEDFDRIPNEPLDEERDMLDLAYGLTETSRLGCQIQMTKELDGLEVQLPETIHDAR